MDGQAIIAVSAAVVGLVSLVKWAGVNAKYGPVAVLILSALGCGLWGFSAGNVTSSTFFDYFSGWVCVAMTAAGIYGFTRASGEQLTRMTNGK